MCSWDPLQSCLKVKLAHDRFLSCLIISKIVGTSLTQLLQNSDVFFSRFQGGKEHGVPILISDIHEGMPAQRCRGLYVGDAILSVNSINLLDVKHSDAVEILSQQVLWDILFSFHVKFENCGVSALETQPHCPPSSRVVSPEIIPAFMDNLEKVMKFR